MDLTKILKKGDNVYCTLYGYVTVTNVSSTSTIEDRVHKLILNFEGGYCASGECLLFPSKDNRDWSTWKINKECPFKPFDKVLVRNNDVAIWSCGFFSHYLYNAIHLNKFAVSGLHWIQCIPYNKETQHLVGTNQDCPDKYKIW